jgi:hypothetical protein
VTAAPTSPPLGDVAGVAESAHQLRPRLRDAADVPAEIGRLVGEAVAGHGRHDDVKCVLGLSAVSGRVGQRADGLEQLDDRAGPAVRHDQRHGVFVRGADVDEVDLDAVDLGRELRQRVESRLDPSEVVVLRPVPGELLGSSELHALGAILDELLARPPCGRDAPTEVVDLLVRDVDAEGADIRGCVASSAHNLLLC